MNKIERDWIADQRSYRRMWKFWTIGNGLLGAAAAVAWLVNRDLAILPFLLGVVYYFRMHSEMNQQLRLRHRDGLVYRYVAWQVGGIFLSSGLYGGD